MFTEYDWMLEEEDWFHEEYYRNIGGLHSESNDSASSSKYCDHVWVNISFNHIRLACKSCGIDKPK